MGQLTQDKNRVNKTNLHVAFHSNKKQNGHHGQKNRKSRISIFSNYSLTKLHFVLQTNNTLYNKTGS